VGNYYFHFQRDIPKAIQFLDKALELSRSRAATKQETIVLNNIALIQWQIGDYPVAQLHCSQAQRLAQLSSNLYEQASALWIVSMCCRELGDYKTAISSCYRGRKQLELCGMSGSYLEHSIMNSAANVHQLKSEYAEARRLHTEIIQHSSASQSYAMGLLNLAEIDIIIGTNKHDVEKTLSQAKAIFTVPRGINLSEVLLADLNLREGKTLVSKSLFCKHVQSAWQNDAELVIFCLERLANLTFWRPSNFPWASQWTILYLVYAQKLWNKLALHKALQFLGDVFLVEGDLDSAHNLFTVGLEGFTFMDVHQSRAQCMLRLGDISKQRGLLSEAVELWTQARPLFERSLQKKEIADIDTRLATVEPQVL
jgi:tetratricopeptide (TPR) repeat protein